ncbi:hypothetical protein TNCV_3736881 [Trichonephila clavipes]|nr:hypothetical protein TNCV_3736881 [Trichonephila clavipes]
MGVENTLSKKSASSVNTDAAKKGFAIRCRKCNCERPDEVQSHITLVTGRAGFDGLIEAQEGIFDHLSVIPGSRLGTLPAGEEHKALR